MSNERWLYVCFVAVVGVALLVLSSDIGALNQTDYSRAVDFMLSGPADPAQPVAFGPPVRDWAYRERIGSPLRAYNTSSVYFWIVGVVQRALLWTTFDLAALAVVSKCAVIVGCAGAASQYARRAGLGVGLAMAAFVLFALCFFMPHASFVYASFYQEHLFYVAFPFLIWGLVDVVPWRARTLIVLSLLACGAAKPQYVYLPALLCATFLAADLFRRRRPDLVLVGLLVAVQLACMSPIHENYERKFNYYHSTFLGSYLFVSPDNAARAGVPASARSCLGVDAWGFRIEGPRLDHATAHHPTCFANRSITSADVVRPYLVEPAILVRMWAAAAPAHWTAFPFHIDRSMPYVVSLHGDAVPSASVLTLIGRARERVITPRYVLVPAAALVAAALLWMRLRQGRPALLVVFLVAFAVGQVVLALFGEGIRDLSKHVMAAQLCLDLLTAICALTVAVLVAHGRRRPVRRAA